MDGHGLRAMFLDYAKPSKVLARDECAINDKLCEVAWEYIQIKAKDLIARAEGRPVIFSYASDSTPLLARCTSTAKSASGSTVVRKAGRGVDFLLQRAFLQTTTSSGEPLITSLTKPPVPLDLGKTAWHEFMAGVKFCRTLRAQGHRGICISHYAYDRALFSALSKKQVQRHALYYEMDGSASGARGQAAVDALTDWVLVAACANHDAQNALKWCLVGLSRVKSDSDVVHDLHIIIESIRNSFDLLLARLRTFIQSSVRFVAAEGDPHELYSFWVNLGVSSEVADKLVDLRLRWRGSVLEVDQKHIGRAGLVEDLSDVMLTIFKFRKFTDSRWTTVGDCCRTLVAALHVGIEGLIQMTRGDPQASDFYLHGAALLCNDVKAYAIIACLVANVPDSALLVLLEDDRVALRADAIANAMNDEIKWLSSISSYTWARLASCLEDRAGDELRSVAIGAAHVACAFVQRRIIMPARSYPWRLTQGDVLANLEKLEQGPNVAEETASKIQQLLRSGFSRQEIASALRLMSQASWTTTIVEQGHGSVAAVHRQHREYSASVLSARSMVHMFRHLVPKEEGAASSRSERQVQRLHRRQPEHAAGRHMFFRDCCRAAERALPSGARLSQEATHQLMRTHAAMYNRLSMEEKLSYESMAIAEAAAKRQRLCDDLELHASSEVLSKHRLLSERLETAQQMKISSARMTMSDMDAMAALFDSPDLTSAKVAALRRQSMTPPDVPPAHWQSAVNEMEVGLPAQDGKECPAWCAAVCAYREMMRGCALLFEAESGIVEPFLFLYAMKQPRIASFLRLTTKGIVIPALSSAASWSEVMALPEFEFWLTRKYCREVEIPWAESSKIFVVPHCVFTEKGTIVSYVDKVLLDDYLGGLPKVAPSRAERTGDAPEKAQADVLKKYPWLAGYVKENDRRSVVAKKGNQDRPDDEPTEATGFDDAELEAIFSALEKKRAEWAETCAPRQPNFAHGLLGGAWTMENRGILADGVKASARGTEAKVWCERYHIGKEKSFRFSKYAESLASFLADFWCARMQYFFDLYVDGDPETFVYTPEDMEGAPRAEERHGFPADLPNRHPFWEKASEIEGIVPK